MICGGVTETKRIPGRFLTELSTGRLAAPVSIAPRRRRLAFRLVMDLGLPTMIVPAGMFTGQGKRILIAWNSSREAARALHDPMPFLQRAELVSV